MSNKKPEKTSKEGRNRVDDGSKNETDFSREIMRYREKIKREEGREFMNTNDIFRFFLSLGYLKSDMSSRIALPESEQTEKEKEEFKSALEEFGDQLQVLREKIKKRYNEEKERREREGRGERRDNKPRRSPFSIKVAQEVLEGLGYKNSNKETEVEPQENFGEKGELEKRESGESFIS